MNDQQVSFIGQLLAERYQIERALGQGSVGSAYRAEDVRTGRPVAVKVFNPDVTPDAASMDALLNDARAATQLVSPNLVPTLDVGVHNERFAFVVEPLLAGKSLERRIDEQGPLGPAQAVRVAIEILLALEVLHRGDMLHLDVKPSNIFMIADPLGLERAVLGGVGTRHVLALSNAPAKAKGTCLARPEYIAPEIVSGKPLTPQTDIYLVGVLLYEMLTGRPPFPGSNFKATARRHALEKPVSPKLVRPQARISDDLDTVVMQCLEKSPKRRFDNPSALARALESIAQAGFDQGSRRPMFRATGGPTAAEAVRPDAEDLASEARRIEQQAAEAQRRAEDARKAAEAARQAEEAARKAAADAAAARKAAEAEKARLAEEAEKARLAEEAKKAAEAKAAEEAKKAADAKAAEEAKKAADAKAAEEAKKAADAKAAEEAKKAADAKAAEEAKKAADAKAAEEAKKAADAKAAEEAKKAADAKAAEEAKKAADAQSVSSGNTSTGEQTSTRSSRRGKRKKKGKKGRGNRQTQSKMAAVKPTPAKAEASAPAAQSKAADANPEPADSNKKTLVQMPAFGAEAPKAEVKVDVSSGDAGKTPSRPAANAEVTLEPGPLSSLSDADGWFVDTTEQLEERHAKLSVYHFQEEQERSIFPFVIAGVAVLVGIIFLVVSAFSEDEADPAIANTPSVPSTAPATTAPKSEAPKTEAPKSEAPKSEAPKSEAPKSEAPVSAAPATVDPAEAAKIRKAELEKQAEAALAAETWTGDAGVIASVKALREIDVKNSVARSVEKKALSSLLGTSRTQLKAKALPEARAAVDAAVQLAPDDRKVKRQLAAVERAEAAAKQAEEAAAAAAKKAEEDAAAAAAKKAEDERKAAEAAIAAAAKQAEDAKKREEAAAAAAAKKAEDERKRAEAAAAAAAKRAEEAKKREEAAAAAAAKKAEEAKKREEARRLAAAKKAEAAKKREEARKAAAAKKAEEAAKRAEARKAAAAKAKENREKAKPLVKNGQRQLAAGQWDAARKSFLEATKVDKRSAVAFAGLSEAAFQQQKFPEAVRYGKRAVGLAGGNATYRVKLGLAHFKLKQYTQAKAQWERALKLKPGHPTATKYLKVVNKRLGG